jgi:protein-tyrosine phosphatase
VGRILRDATCRNRCFDGALFEDRHELEFANPKKDAMKLLFLCTGNYYRSRFAEYYVRHRASELGLDWSVDSRGLGLTSSNVGPLSQYTIAECERIGISCEPCRLPLALSTSDLEQADRTIALKEAEHRPMLRRLFPDWESRVEYWQVHDIDCAAPEEALPWLRRLLDQLIEQRAAC